MLRVDRMMHPVHSLGPGLRVALWVTGCLKRCPGCISPSLLSERAGVFVTVENLIERILALKPVPEGLTISGGEPFLQPEPLARLCRKITGLTGMNVMVYSGYTLDELRQGNAETRSLLGAIDILIDGEYVREQPTDLLWRGSANQRLLLLSTRAQATWPELPDARYEGSRDVALSLTRGGSIVTAGIPAPGDLARLSEMAESDGVRWKYV